MAATFGLPDDEIDRLLSEAEARLSGNGSVDVVVVAVAGDAAAAAKTPTTVVAPPVPTAGEQTSVPEKKSEKLTVRVPQLPQKNKVRSKRCRVHHPHVFPDESKSQTL
jgi:tryptophanyl-tRNA synthetase